MVCFLASIWVRYVCFFWGGIPFLGLLKTLKGNHTFGRASTTKIASHSTGMPWAKKVAGPDQRIWFAMDFSPKTPYLVLTPGSKRRKRVRLWQLLAFFTTYSCVCVNRSDRMMASLRQSTGAIFVDFSWYACRVALLIVLLMESLTQNTLFHHLIQEQPAVSSYLEGIPSWCSI